MKTGIDNEAESRAAAAMHSHDAADLPAYAARPSENLALGSGALSGGNGEEGGDAYE